MLLVVVDLDGTVVRTNTYPRWVVTSTVGLLRHGRPGAAARMGSAMLARRSGRLPHEAAKERVDELTAALPEGIAARFAARMLSRYVNEAVRDRIDRHLRAGDELVLATAAPEVYARHVAGLLGITEVLASRRDDTGFQDNRGEAKLAAIQLFFPGRTVDLLYTDHHDDLPLVEVATHTVLVHPTEELLLHCHRYLQSGRCELLGQERA